MSITETVDNVTTTIGDSGVEVTVGEVSAVDTHALNVVNAVTGWAESNPKTAVVAGTVVTVATGVVVWQLTKKLFS